MGLSLTKLDGCSVRLDNFGRARGPDQKSHKSAKDKKIHVTHYFLV